MTRRQTFESVAFPLSLTPTAVLICFAYLAVSAATLARAQDAHGADAEQAESKWNDPESSPNLATVDAAETAGHWLPPAGLDPTNVIDLMIEQGWRDRQVTPADRCSDAEFVRRVYLDLAGRIPSHDEAQAFAQNMDSRKREQLIDQLLASDQFARNAAEMLDVVLLGRSTRERNYRRRLESPWFGYLERAFRENRPWDQMVRDILMARPTGADDEGAQWFLYERGDKYQEIAEAVSPGFFGVQIQCAQCHDHPLASEIEQRHYWGLVAFFNRGSRVDAPQGPRVAESAVGGFNKFTDLAGIASDSVLTFLGSDAIIPEEQPAEEVKETDPSKDAERYLLQDESGQTLQPPIPKFSRRQQFVDVIVRDNPLIARACVNRMWGWLMGRGIVHPVDRMDSDTPISHPELLDWLARDFEQHGYDLKRLIKAIVSSRAYQLTSTRTSDLVGDEAFAWSIARPMTAESYYRSLLQLVDGSQQSASTDQLMEFQSQFPDVFPVEAMTNLGQALFLSNNDTIQSAVNRGADRLWLPMESQQTESSEWQQSLIQNLYQDAYGRTPDAEELQQCVSYLGARADRPRDAIAQLLWVIATSSEFRFNH
jgi:hypothetical protein